MGPEPLYQPPMMGEMVVQLCQKWPERVALAGTGYQLTYRQMASFISRTIQYFKSLGLAPGDPLALLTKNCAEGVAVFYATNVMGLRYTPLHPMGSAEDHAFILHDGEVGTLVVDKAFEERAEWLAQEVGGLQHVIRLRDPGHSDDLEGKIEAFEDRALKCEADPQSDACLIYTGGTTGLPKGVRLSQLAIATMNNIALLEWEWPAEVRALVLTPISHAGMSLLLPTHWRGGTMHLAEQFTTDGFLETVQAQEINVTFMVPTMIYAILDCENLDQFDTSSMALILYGAAPMSPARLAEAMERMGPVFGQIYGQSEAPMVLTYLSKADHEEALISGRQKRLASCGTACAGMTVTLLDEEGHAVRTAGEVGEICARGPLVMKGYYNRPEETAEALRNGWLYTGDMAYRDEQGYYYIVDRSKDMIISGGFNVFPKEVEDIIGEYPGVSSVAVIGVPDDKWGEKVLAVVIPKPGQTLDATAITRLVKEKKGSVYAPKVVEFTDQIPLTGLGKPDKKALRTLYWGDSERNVS